MLARGEFTPDAPEQDSAKGFGAYGNRLMQWKRAGACVWIWRIFVSLGTLTP
jgi:hypothetical protein